MGYFSKADNQGDTLSGGSGSWVMRSIKKVFYAVIVIISFGIYKAGVSGEILDIALRNNVPISEAFQVAFIKAMQYGTLKAPEMLFSGLSSFLTYPITSIFQSFIPFLFIYGAWFQITSIIVDILDGRRTDSIGFAGKALATAGLMIFIYAIYTGVAFFEPTVLTFDSTQIAIEEGWINGTVNESVSGGLN